MLKEENYNKKKEEIMKTCFDTFCKYGLAETSVNRLAEACKMSRGNFYNYFKIACIKTDIKYTLINNYERSINISYRFIK